MSPPPPPDCNFLFSKKYFKPIRFTTLFTNTSFLAHIGQFFPGSSLGPSKEGVGVCVQKSVTKVITKEIPSAEYEGTYKGPGSFHIHRKTMKELGTLAVLDVREQLNLSQKLVTHRL